MNETLPAIDSFRGEYGWLSNFFTTYIDYDGFTYKNAEAAFQAQKTLDPTVRASFTRMSGAEAKRHGRSRRVDLRPDWDQVKDRIMLEIVAAKFDQNRELAEKLMATGSRDIVEGNDWNDTYWGAYRGRGQNKLGRILMAVREKLISEKGVSQ